MNIFLRCAIYNKPWSVQCSVAANISLCMPLCFSVSTPIDVYWLLKAKILFQDWSGFRKAGLYLGKVALCVHKTNLSLQSELNPQLSGTESHPEYEKVQFRHVCVHDSSYNFIQNEVKLL
jgi:hypothetical protein